MLTRHKLPKNICIPVTYRATDCKSINILSNIDNYQDCNILTSVGLYEIIEKHY